ncbi:hypothetical protein [uncultured Winogradskyella sp.]|uniref:hypothetical protein n=1 Tax=uncultured Winogradskyella sp. TaxID=395353 RepID=UPI00263048D0|nr:hypothetical protein [uncultured Winogradskyella sp.]
MSKLRSYKGRTFREGYNPTKAEFKKSHGKFYSEEELEEAFKVLQGKEDKK